MWRLLQNSKGRLLFNTGEARNLVRHASRDAATTQHPQDQSQNPKAKATQASTDKGDKFSVKHCINLVEKHDYENYLCTLLLPLELRRTAFALRAFNVAVSCAAVGGNTNEPQLAKMRLKFWYDSIDKCFEPENSKSYVKDQPVLRELKRVIATCKLNKVYLRRLVTARERPPTQGFQTIRELEEYADQTCSSLLHLLVELSGVRDMQVDHAASHLGKAQGIIMLLRAIPLTGRQHAICVPMEVLVRHGVSQERILRSSPEDKGVEECVFEVASAANTHLKLARQLLPQIPSVARKIFLPAVCTDTYLERLRRAHFLLNHASCLKRDTMLPARLYWKSLFNKY